MNFRKWEKEILELLMEAEDGCSKRELIAGTGTHDWSIHKALQHLMDESLVEREPGQHGGQPSYLYKISEYGKKAARGEV